MTELKRPERYVQFESIKPELREITEFYTRKTADYQYRLKQLNEYADALENEISVLKETLKVEVLLDDMPKLDGYTVEKEKLFYLKSKMTGRYLRSYTGLGMNDTTLRYEEVDDRRACGFGGGTTFTQSEIDKLHIGSYEQIEVEP